MPKYGKIAANEVKKERHEFKEEKAHSGKGGAKIKSKKQAITIGLLKARKKCAKGPNKKN